MLIPEAT